MHRSHQFGLIPGLAVGDEEHGLHMRIHCVFRQGLLDRRQHLRPTTGLETCDPAIGVLEGVLIVGRETLGKYIGRLIEGNELEAVAFDKPMQGTLQRALGCLDLRPSHRAGNIDHKYGIARHRIWHRIGRRLHHNQRVRTICPGTQPGLFIIGGRKR